METPSTLRRVTRSQTSILSHRTMPEIEAASTREKGRTAQKKKQDRSVLLDISNDSPIVGLAAAAAAGGVTLKTPASSVSKSTRAPLPKKTPGTGEVLLRGQVKSLLEKVEEDANLVKLPSSSANTPLVLGLPAVQEQSDTKMAKASEGEDGSLSGESQINRALLFDSPEKSEIEKSSDAADSSSICPIDVTIDDDTVDKNGGLIMLDDLCNGLTNLTMDGEEKKTKGLPEFTGKHTRFVYNSDDEMEGEEEVSDGEKKEKDLLISPNVIVLKGLPLPEGKHLRFHDDDAEEEEE